MTEKLFRDADDLDTLHQPNSAAGTPGKSTLTSRMSSGRPSQVIFRVESAEAAHAFADRFGPRDSNGVAAGADDHVDRAASSSGSSLPGDLRDRFETSLGANLSDVRVHTGPESETATKAVGAKAYTMGNDIHFGAGQYNPSSSDGMFLIAHEVAHTVQQAGSTPSRQNKLEVSHPQDAAEAQADDAARSMLAGEPARVTSMHAGVSRLIQREEDQCVMPDETAPPEPEPAAPVATEGPQCLTPPKALNWGGTAAAPACPSSPWSGTPFYQDGYATDEGLATYRAAFDDSWFEAQASFNNVYKMNDTIRGTEKEVAPILRISPDSKVGVQGQGANATDSFAGDKLKPEVSKVDAGKVSSGVREEILAAKEALTTAQIEVTNKAIAVANTKDGVADAEDTCTQAKNNLKITESDAEIEKLGLDKAQIERDLETYKAGIEATVESVKAVTSIIKIFDPTQSPKDKISNILGAVDQGATAAGKIGEAALIANANSKIDAIDKKIGSLNTTKASLNVTNAKIEIEKCKRAIKSAKRAVLTALGEYKVACIAFEAKYRALGVAVAKAGKDNKMSAKDQKQLAAAVEAIPKIKNIIEFCEGMSGNIPAPAYNEPSGIGAAMACNFHEFQSNLAVVKGTDTYVQDTKTTWEGRLASVEAIIDGATAVPSDW